MRIVLSSLLTFAILMFAWTYVTDKGYEKVKPKIEEQQRLIEEKQQQAKQLMKQEIQDLGGDPDLYDQIDGMDIPEEYKIKPSQRPLRPEGTYMGVLKGAETKIAMAKFDKDRYWIMIKDHVTGDTKEKGKYDFQFTEMYFQPNGERDYFAGYEQMSPESFRLVVGAGTFFFERTDDVRLDF